MVAPRITTVVQHVMATHNLQRMRESDTSWMIFMRGYPRSTAVASHLPSKASNLIATARALVSPHTTAHASTMPGLMWQRRTERTRRVCGARPTTAGWREAAAARELRSMNVSRFTQRLSWDTGRSPIATSTAVRAMRAAHGPIGGMSAIGVDSRGGESRSVSTRRSTGRLGMSRGVWASAFTATPWVMPRRLAGAGGWSPTHRGGRAKHELKGEFGKTLGTSSPFDAVCLCLHSIA